MLLKLKIALSGLLLLSAHSAATMDYPKWQTVGTAKLSVLWFDIYQAELSSQNGVYEQEKSFKLKLTYLRDFAADDLIEETFKQMPGPISQQQQNSWQKQLSQLWPDVQELESISFVKDELEQSHFYHNNKYLGKIDDPLFAKQFAAIWLASTSEYPKLAAQLKGEKP